jgi:DNA-binding response OmpR family regulator
MDSHGRASEARAAIDDYLWRPFPMIEFVVRIRSILRTADSRGERNELCELL